MMLYINSNNSLKKIEENPFKLEKELQKILEKNLYSLTGLTLVKSEFSIKNKRFDTLAYDEQSKAFIIIEYKREKNSSVVDQGFTYLNLMLENKAEFIVEYNENLGKKLKRDEVDWSQTRVVFVASSFTDNQIQATNFRDIAIELWEVKRYQNDIIMINHIKKSKSAESIKPLIGKNASLTKITNEIKVYTEEDHINKGSDETVELYEKFKSAILNLSDNIETAPKKLYVAFKKDSNICGIEIRKNDLKIFINAKKGTLDDPKHLMRDVSNIGHWGTGDYNIVVSSDKDMEYIMSLIKQVI